MKQGKLEVVKQEMASVNVDILGISELKWTGTGEFNLDGLWHTQEITLKATEKLKGFPEAAVWSKYLIW